MSEVVFTLQGRLIQVEGRGEGGGGGGGGGGGPVGVVIGVLVLGGGGDLGDGSPHFASPGLVGVEEVGSVLVMV